MADSGITPARRLRVCATTCWVRPITVVEVVDRLVQLAFACPGGSAQRAAGVAHHRASLTHGRFGDVGEFPGDAPHRGLGLIALLLGRAAAAWRRSSGRVDPPSGADHGPGYGCAHQAVLIRATLRHIEPMPLANNPESVG